jgi:glycosyltransferase involved in cell wall biosynthesis
MKILLVNKFHYLRGGSEKYYFSLANALKENGHEVICFSMQDDINFDCDQSDYFVNNVDYNNRTGVLKKVKSGINLIYSREAKIKLERLINDEKPDIAHFNLVHRQITLSIVDVLKKYNIPIAFTMHDLICACPNCTMLSHGNICEKCMNGNYINCIKQKCVKDSLFKSVLAVVEAYFIKQRNFYNKISLYIAPSNFYRDKLIESKFTKSPIIHMANFLPTNTIFELPSKIQHYLLYFGRLSSEKGIITLLSAMKNDTNGHILYILGEGPQRQEIEQYINDNRLQNRVKLLGFKNGTELQDIILQSKCVILPSEWYENSPYSIMEAMSKGRPVIVSDLGGVTEMVEDGVTGYIFKSRDADSLRKKIDKIMMMKDDEYNTVCLAALNKAKLDYNADNYIHKLINLYDDLITKSGRTING